MTKKHIVTFVRSMLWNNTRKIHDIKTFRSLFTNREGGPPTLTFSKQFVEEVYNKRTADLLVTDEELYALRIILNNMGGHPDTTLRGYADSIANKINAFEAVDRCDRFTSPGARTLYFGKNSKSDPDFQRLVENVD